MRFEYKELTEFPYYLRYYFTNKTIELIPGDYILSDYIKSDKPNIKVGLGTFDGGNPENPAAGIYQELAITQNWERYSLNLHFDEKYGRYAYIRLPQEQNHPDEKAWIDDIMLPKGTNLSQYKASIDSDYIPFETELESRYEAKITGLNIHGNFILPR